MIEDFAADMFGGFARRDQRSKGELYLRGLLLDGKRKSMQPMGERLGVDHQQLQQFVTTSTWDHVEVRRRLAVWARDFVDPDAFAVDDTAFPKDGHSSPGVARMYCGALGKTANCQVGVSVHAVTDWASAALDWRLFLPESWDDRKATGPDQVAEVRHRRQRCSIPDEARHREKWRLALDMIDELAGWGLPARPVVADAGYGDSSGFRQGLTDYWLSTLPPDIRLRDLVRIAKIRWRIEHNYRELKDGLGLDHFEGRSWTGWHRHVTLASLAQAICTKLRRTPKAPAQD